jgi:hypothetical protein
MIDQCPCHDTASPILRAVNTPRPRLPVPKPVTFAQFARAGRRHGWSVEFLTKWFRGKVDEPGELFSRMFDRFNRHGANVIPFRTVLDFYWRETAAARVSRLPRKAA